MNRERGLTLIGLIFILFFAAILALVAFRVIPAYIDYFTIKHSLQTLLDEGTDQSDADLRASLDKRLNVNYIQDITARDLEISRDGGMLTLTVPISRKEPLVGGVSICVDLDAIASKPISR